MVEPTDDVKILMAGLDRAGKSSIIQTVFFGQDPSELTSLRPTRGVQRESVQVAKGDQFVFWELGGQQHYREDYTFKPQLLVGSRLLLFVIDLQDDDRYELSLNYLRELLNMTRTQDLNPKVDIILHKFDPDKASVLRSKQFAIFKSLKLIQSDFPHISFTQHSTSIYDETLYYSFQKIFNSLGVDLGLYKKTVQSQVSLRGRDHESTNKTRTEEIMSERLLTQFESVSASARSGLLQLAPDLADNSSVSKLHATFRKFTNTFHQQSSLDQRRESIDAIIMSYIEYLADLASASLTDDLISEQEAQLIFVYISQLNFIKAKFSNYLLKIDPQRLAPPLKFMEEIKQLTNDLLECSFVVSSISLPQLQDLKDLVNGMSNPNFSLFRQDNKDVYTFSSLLELKSAFSQDRFIPEQLIHNVGLAEQLQASYIKKFEAQLLSLDLDQSQQDVIEAFLMRLEYLILVFYHWIIEHNLREYDIERIMDNRFHELTGQLLLIANLGSLFASEEAVQLRGILGF